MQTLAALCIRRPMGSAAWLTYVRGSEDLQNYRAARVSKRLAEQYCPKVDFPTVTITNGQEVSSSPRKAGA